MKLSEKQIVDIINSGSIAIEKIIILLYFKKNPLFDISYNNITCDVIHINGESVDINEFIMYNINKSLIYLQNIKDFSHKDIHPKLRQKVYQLLEKTDIKKLIREIRMLLYCNGKKF